MRLLLAIAALLTFAATAQAQMIDKLTPANVGAAFEARGLRYVETTDNRGFPLLQVETAGTFDSENMNVFFYSCAPEGCEDITLYSWYQPSVTVTADMLNAWNDIFRHTRNWSRAYIDEEGDVVLVMHINATGGIGPDALQILINTYLVEARDFGAYVVAVE